MLGRQELNAMSARSKAGGRSGRKYQGLGTDTKAWLSWANLPETVRTTRDGRLSDLQVNGLISLWKQLGWIDVKST